MSDYRPNDQQEKLGDPPWRPADPALIAWEAAHGHDIRLKCIPEYGCRAVEGEADRMRERLTALRDKVYRSDEPEIGGLLDAILDDRDPLA